jgi:5-methylthioadenosine/S-adenosylhomocysteine deaminase
VYALKGADVDDVMVNGRLLVRARRALSLDPASIRARAEEFRRNIANSIRAH